MNWRRVAEAMKLKRAVQLMDEREAHAKEIEVLTKTAEEQTEAVKDMSLQARLGSYRRVKVPR